MTRAILYDATLAADDPSPAEPADRVIQLALAAESARDIELVRFGPGGLLRISAMDVARRSAAFAKERPSADAFSATRAWIVGSEFASPRDAAQKRPSRPRAGWTGVAPPRGAVYVKTGLQGWEDPRLTTWLAGREDIVVVALVGNPWQVDFPEYAAFDARAAFDAMRRRANAIVPLNDAAAARLLPSPRLASLPSALAGAAQNGVDRPLADAPFLVQIGPIEARANTLLLLQIWRDFARSGAAVPKLVLAGQRGAQVEDITPMLDWGETIRPHVREAAHLDPEQLRRLVVHARAVLAPDFAAADCAALRDACALGTKVVASSIGVFDEVDGPRVERLHPLAGPAWRAAVVRAAQAEPRRAADEVILPGWAEWRRGLLGFLRSL
jgi:hypothetical protein